MEAAENLVKPYDSSDPESVANARKKLGRDKKKERDIVAALMSHPDGRTLLFNSVKCIFTGQPYVFDNINATFFNLGQEFRARGLFQEIIKLSPKDFITMMEEHGDEI